MFPLKRICDRVGIARQLSGDEEQQEEPDHCPFHGGNELRTEMAVLATNAPQETRAASKPFLNHYCLFFYRKELKRIEPPSAQQRDE